MNWPISTKQLNLLKLALNQLTFSHFTFSQLKMWVHHWGWLGLAAAISLGQLEKITILGLPIYLHEILMLAWLGWSWHQDKTWQTLSIKNLIMPLILLCWVVFGWLANEYQPSQDVRPVFYLLRMVFYAGFALTLAKTTQPMTKANLRYSSVVVGLLLAWFGILQLIFIPDLRFLAVFGYDDHFYRLASTLLDPTYTGLILVIAYFLLAKYELKHSIKWLLNIFLVVTIYFTYSRSVYLAFLAVMLIDKLISKLSWHTRFLSFGVIFISLIGLALLPTPKGEGGKLFRIETIFARARTSQQVLSTLSGPKLWYGNGLFLSVRESANEVNALSIPNRANLPDNLLIAILSGTGLVGLSIFGYLVLWLLLKVHLVDEGIFLALLAVLIHAQFNNDLTQPHILAILALMIGSLKLKSKLNK